MLRLLAESGLCAKVLGSSPCSWGGFAAPRAWRQPWGGAGGPACPAVPPSGTPALLGQGAPAQPAAKHPGKASFYISPLILLQLVSHSPFWSPSQGKGTQDQVLPGPGCSKSSPPIPRYVYAPRRARKRREKAPTLLSVYFQTQPAEQHSCLGVLCVRGSFPQGLGHPGDRSCTHPRQGTGKAGRGGWADTSNGARSCPFGACGPGGKLRFLVTSWGQGLLSCNASKKQVCWLSKLHLLLELSLEEQLQN